MVEPVEYVEGPTGAIHLALPIILDTPAHTLCGRDRDGWPALDETLSGGVATCGTCRRLYGVKY